MAGAGNTPLPPSTKLAGTGLTMNKHGDSVYWVVAMIVTACVVAFLVVLLWAT